MPRLRATVVTDIPFWQPGVGSHRRIEQICETFGQFFDLDVFVFRSISVETRRAIAAKRYPFRLISYKDFENKEKHSLKTTVNDVLPALRKWYAPSWHEAFHSYVKRNPPQIVITEYLRMQYVIRELDESIVTILDSHDIISLRSMSLYAFGVSVPTSLSLQEERALMNSYNFVLAISRPDYAWLQRFLRPTSAVFLPYMPNDAAIKPPTTGSPKRLIFAGANSQANADALRWFVAQVMPYLDRDIHLSVYGDVGKCIEAGPRLQVHGMVENVADIYKEFGTAINPVFFGGGLKIKSLEALSVGLPLVSSTEGARGLEQFSGLGFYIARSRQEFFDQVRLATGADTTAQILSAQRSAAFESYRLEAACAPFLSILQQLAEQGRAWAWPAMRSKA